jgi:hypothetical protein
MRRKGVVCARVNVLDIHVGAPPGGFASDTTCGNEKHCAMSATNRVVHSRCARVRQCREPRGTCTRADVGGSCRGRTVCGHRHRECGHNENTAQEGGRALIKAA